MEGGVYNLSEESGFKTQIFVAELSLTAVK
jgi:hypothetical protein